MPRDILSEYGPDASKPQAGRAKSGGDMPVRDVMNYKPPYGPTNIKDTPGPGLHGYNCGNANKPTGADANHDKIGLGGTVHRSGSQRG